MNELPDANSLFSALDSQTRGIFSCLDNSVLGFLCVFDVERRQLVALSRGSERAIGYSAEHVLSLGDGIRALVHPDDLPKFVDLEPELMALADGETRELEWRLVRPDGGHSWLRSRVSVLRRNPAGQVQQVLAAMDHVAETNRMDERLAYQSMLLENVSDAIVATDERLVVTSWNRAAEQLYGWTAVEALGRTLPEVLRTEVTDAEREAALRLALTTGEYRAEVRQRTKDGALLIVDSYARTLRDARGQFRGLVGVNRNVTVQKEAQAVLRRAHDELETLVAARTSELAERTERLHSEVRERQQLEQARVQLLQRMNSMQEDERRRIARELHDELGAQMTILKMAVIRVSEHLKAGADAEAVAAELALVANGLDTAVASVRSLATELRPPLLDLFGLVPALESYFNTFLARTGPRGEAHWPAEDLPLTEEATTALFRIFQETLTNIARHALASRVTIGLERQAGHVLMRVADDGRGIPAQTASGHWGLAGMRERAELVGGRLEVESEGQNGTTVIVRMPLTG